MKIISQKYSLPDMMVTNQDICDRVKKANSDLPEPQLKTLLEKINEGFDLAKTRFRYQLSDGENVLEMVVNTAREAISDADINPEDIDLIIYTGIGRGFLEPSMAHLVQSKLGVPDSTCFDIIDACASWLRALEISSQFLAAGKYKNVLIVNGECVSKLHKYNLENFSDFDHWFPRLTIGDAVTASIITNDPDSGFEIDFKTNPKYSQLCYIPLRNRLDYTSEMSVGDTFEFVSYGKKIMTAGSVQLIKQYLSSEKYNKYSPKVVFGHAASDGMCEFIGRKCNIGLELSHLVHHKFGNVISASLPIAMADAVDCGKLQRGDDVLVMYASAGITTTLAKFSF